MHENWGKMLLCWISNFASLNEDSHSINLLQAKKIWPAHVDLRTSNENMEYILSIRTNFIYWHSINSIFHKFIYRSIYWGSKRNHIIIETRPYYERLLCVFTKRELFRGLHELRWTHSNCISWNLFLYSTTRFSLSLLPNHASANDFERYLYFAIPWVGQLL